MSLFDHGGRNWARNENSLKTLKSGFILCETSFLVNINTFPICDNLKKIEKKFFEQKICRSATPLNVNFFEKIFFRFSCKNRLFRVISRRKIDCAHFLEITLKNRFLQENRKKIFSNKFTFNAVADLQ